MFRDDLIEMRKSGGPLVTRFAPSPTGYLHLGHVVNAIYVWGIAGVLGARVILRIEDHDRTRCRPEYERALIEDLDWLGFQPHEGRHPIVRQSERGDVYRAALSTLERTAHVYTCRCSRRDIGSERYPGTCRNLALDANVSHALRVEIDPGWEEFEDALLGPQRQAPSAQSGDLLLRDRHKQWTYQFAVTVDDIAQGVNLVIRGHDLLESTGRQLRLARMLGHDRRPLFIHHPLLLERADRKLSKSDGSTGIRALRAAGLTAAQVIGRAAAHAGLTGGGTDVPADAVTALLG